MNQHIINKAVNMATKAAMNGHPVDRILWVPPVTATQDPDGCFVVYYAPPQSPSITPTWEL
jgi:hypothetical protein